MASADDETESARKSDLSVSLASTLFELEQEGSDLTRANGGRLWRTGIKILDRELPLNMLNGGQLISIATSPQLDLSASLCTKIAATHILDSAQRASRANISQNPTLPVQPTVYILAQPQDVVTTIKQLHGAIPPASDAASLLSNVSILQYLNLAGLAESISDVSGALSPVLASARQRTLLLVQGLTSVLSEAQRRSGLVQTAAVFASVLGSIQSIARSGHGSLLVLLELEANWVQVLGASVSAQSSGVTTAVASPASSSFGGEGVVLESAFASSIGKVLKVTGVGSVQAKLVEEASETVIVVHDGDGRIQKGRDRAIVEIVKSSDAFGKWSIWE